MQVGDIMTTSVRTCTIDHTFADAATILHEHHIASVIIVGTGDREGAVEGIVTERDLVDIVAEGLDPATTMLTERMTSNLTVASPRTDIADAAATMAELRIRHLPVLDEQEQLVGICSIRDLWRWALGELTAGHELPDLDRAHRALHAAVAVKVDPKG